MTITYFLMLLFVFWTCFRVGMFFTNVGLFHRPGIKTWAVIVVNLLYASAGTLFFHNVW